MPNIVRFDCFEADLESGQLCKRGVRIKLREQAFQVLAYLLQHPGSVVTREELRQQLWRGVFVDFENNLNMIVSRLREALGDSVERPRFIETLPKRGYRFLPAVSPSAHASASPHPKRARLIVLPFVNLSGDPEQEYFSDAITDEMITELAALAPQQLAVIARTTAMTYKTRPAEVAAIRRGLGVDYVVEGSVRRTEASATVNVQLIQAGDQTHLFANRYVAPLQEMFNLQNRIAQELAEHIPTIAELVREGQVALARTPRKPTDDLAAYNEYILGRYHLSKGVTESAEAAKLHLEKALLRDPDFALAHDALGEIYWYLGYLGIMSPRQAFSAGIVHALRAIEIDNTRAETHALIGEFHKTLEYNWPEVHREMALALQLDPNSPLVRMRYAVSELMPHGRLEEAVTELDRALAVDPLSLLPRFWKGIVLLLARHFQEAIDEAQKLLDLDPTYYLSYFILGNAYRYQGRFDDALHAQHKALELSGGAAWILGWLGLTMAHGGDSARARDALHRLHAMAQERYVPASSFAWIHLGLREIDSAFEWLHRAVDERDQLMMPIKSYAFFDPIRSDPRFTQLLHRMNLQP